MKHLFIINPAAGKKESTAYLEGLLKQLPFPHEVEYTITFDSASLTKQ